MIGSARAICHREFLAAVCLLAPTGCLSINDVKPKFDLVDTRALAPVDAGVLRCGTVFPEPGERDRLQDRTAELALAVEDAGLFRRAALYADWDTVDIVVEVQERRVHHQMGKWVRVFTILPPFWGLWLPYTSWQQREYLVNTYDSGRLISTHRFRGDVEGWTWFFFTPDFDSAFTDSLYLNRIGEDVASKRNLYRAVAEDHARRPLDRYDLLYFVRLARLRDLRFQQERILRTDPTFIAVSKEYFGSSLALSWIYQETPVEMRLLEQRRSALGSDERGATATCPLCRRVQDGRFLYCDRDGMPLTGHTNGS